MSNSKPWLKRMLISILQFFSKFLLDGLSEGETFYVIFDNFKIFKSTFLDVKDGKYFFIRFAYIDEKIYILSSSISLSDDLFVKNLPDNISLLHDIDSFCLANDLNFDGNKFEKNIQPISDLS